MKAASCAGLAVALVSTCLMLLSCSKNPQKAKSQYLAEGQSYMKKAKYGDAAIEFRNALRIDPRFVDAYYNLAQAELAQHNWVAAYGSLQKTIELDPARLDARLDRGRLYLAAREFGSAESEADYILKEQAGNVGAYQLLGVALIGQKKPDQALEAFTKIIELRPNDANAYVNMALIEISLSRPLDAEQHLKKALAVDPHSIQSYADLATLYRLKNRLPEAEAILQQGIANNPDGTLLYIESASMLASQGKKDDAEAVLDKLRKLLPNSPGAAMALGNYYFEHRQTDQALAEYRRGVWAAPKNVDLKKRLQDLYLTTGQVGLASDLDKELMKEVPKDVIARTSHGRLLMALGKPQDAIIYLQGVVADAADSPQAHYYLAMAFWQNGDLSQARGAFEDSLKISQNPPALEALARLSVAQGDVADAQIYAQEAVQQAPSDVRARQLLAQTLVRQGKLHPAEQQILIAQQLAPDASVIHADLGEIYVAERKWPEAQKEFELALHLDPRSTVVLAQFADFLIARNQSIEALARVQQYVATNENDSTGHVILGSLKLKLNNYASAEAEFKRAIQIDPHNVPAYLKLGKVFEAQGKTDLAVASYQKGLDLQPNFPALATIIGNLYLSKHEWERARKYYAQALASDPNYASAMANTAWIDALEGKDLDVALSMAQRANSLQPDVPSITDTLAWVMYKKGSYASAIPLLRECVRKSPESAEYHYHLGMNLVALGEKASGKQELEAALHLQPDSANEQEIRQTLAQLN